MKDFKNFEKTFNNKIDKLIKINNNNFLFPKTQLKKII